MCGGVRAGVCVCVCVSYLKMESENIQDEVSWGYFEHKAYLNFLSFLLNLSGKQITKCPFHF